MGGDQLFVGCFGDKVGMKHFGAKVFEGYAGWVVGMQCFGAVWGLKAFNTGCKGLQPGTQRSQICCNLNAVQS